MTEPTDNDEHVDPALEAVFGAEASFSLRDLPAGKLLAADRWAVGVRYAGKVLWLDSGGTPMPRPCIVTGAPRDVTTGKAREEAVRRMELWESVTGCRGGTLVIEPILTEALPR